LRNFIINILIPKKKESVQLDSVGGILAKLIQDSPIHFSKFLPASPCQSAVFLTTDADEVVAVIFNLKSKFSVVVDNILISVIKRCAYVISKPLSCIFNLSLETGCFPKLLKI